MQFKVFWPYALIQNTSQNQAGSAGARPERSYTNLQRRELSLRSVWAFQSQTKHPEVSTPELRLWLGLASTAANGCLDFGSPGAPWRGLTNPLL